MRRLMLILPAALLLIAGLGYGATWTAHRLHWLAPGDDPWGRLDLDAPPGWFTRAQLLALTRDPVACFTTLRAGHVAFEAIPDEPIIDGCGFADALRYAGEKARFKAPVVLTCAMTAAYVLFERQVLQPAAERELRSRITAVEDWGTYNCRNIGREEGRRRSEHAKANAIDLAGFTTAGGRRVTVTADWGKGDAGGRFLLALRDGACRWFKVVLGPDHDPTHHDHLHLDMGPFDACR